MPRILFVDDDRDTCRNIADLFSDLGYAIDTAECGDIALEKARKQQYDLGLLDLRMPGMDGLPLSAPQANAAAHGNDDSDRVRRRLGRRSTFGWSEARRSQAGRFSKIVGSSS
jgi:hypothetical protein